MTTCRLCGAVAHGNITCPLCRRHMDFLSDEVREQLAGIPIIHPAGTKPGDKHHRIINYFNLRRNTSYIITECTVIGITGGCGLQCDVFKDGKCLELDTLLDDLERSKDFTDQDKKTIKAKYK